MKRLFLALAMVVMVATAAWGGEWNCIAKECEVCGMLIYHPEESRGYTLSGVAISGWGVSCQPYANEDTYSKTLTLCDTCERQYWSDLKKILDDRVKDWLDIRQGENAKQREQNAKANHNKRLDQLEEEMNTLKSKIEKEKCK